MSQLPVNEKKRTLHRERSNATHGMMLSFIARDAKGAENHAFKDIELSLQLEDTCGISSLEDLKYEWSALMGLIETFDGHKVNHPRLSQRLEEVDMILQRDYAIDPIKNRKDRLMTMITSTTGELSTWEDLKKQAITNGDKEKTEVCDKIITALQKQIKIRKQQLEALDNQPKQKEPGKTMSAAAQQASKNPTGGKDVEQAGKDLAQAVRIQNVEVVRHGDKLTIPTNLDIHDAIALLQARARYEEEVATIIETFDVFPWDGAIALGRVLKARFGWIPQQGASVRVDSGINQKTDVPWGEFTVPGIDGKMRCDIAGKEGRVIFQVRANVKHKHEHVIKQILEDVREILKTTSIYRGKAIKIRFLDDDGEKLPMPEPKFIDVESIDEHSVAYAKPVQDAIETNLFTPIRRVNELQRNGLKLQRSVMLGGMFGTGKTLAAGVAAKLAVQNGLTYIYVPRADELSHAIAFSKMYQDPACMIFCEDLDRVMKGERSVKIDDILNIIDGVDTKNDRRMMVFTTNDLDALQPAMLRPGRLDAVIEVTPPDALAAWKLVQIYGGNTLRGDVDGTLVGQKLAGHIPAVIAEVVKRAKLSELKLTPVGQTVRNISTQALLDAAETMVRQLDLLNRGEKQYMPLDEALARVGEAMSADPNPLPHLKKVA